jgi:ACS family tartrate transporter-like MFS transporter
MYGALPTFWTLPTGMLTGAGAAAGIALINSIGNVGGYVGPVILGYLRGMTSSHASGLYSLAAVCAMAAVLVLIAGRQSRLAPTAGRDRQ